MGLCVTCPQRACTETPNSLATRAIRLSRVERTYHEESQYGEQSPRARTWRVLANDSGSGAFGNLLITWSSVSKLVSPGRDLLTKCPKFVTSAIGGASLRNLPLFGVGPSPYMLRGSYISSALQVHKTKLRHDTFNRIRKACTTAYLSLRGQGAELAGNARNPAYNACI